MSEAGESDETETESAPEPAPESDGDSGDYQPAFQIQNERKESAADISADSDSESAELPENDFGSESEPDSDGFIDADGETVESVEVPTVDAETIKPALKATFSLLGGRRGDYWELSDSEAKTLSEAYAPVLNKYAPHMADQYGPETMALMTTAVVVSPRLSKDYETGKFQSLENPDETLTESRGFESDETEPEARTGTEPEPNDETNEERGRVSAFENL